MAYIQRWSIIKNSAVKVSDERAIDAFIVRLRRGDLVKEMGRIKPKNSIRSNGRSEQICRWRGCVQQ
jgi:hypothetical protein